MIITAIVLYYIVGLATFLIGLGMTEGKLVRSTLVVGITVGWLVGPVILLCGWLETSKWGNTSVWEKKKP